MVYRLIKIVGYTQEEIAKTIWPEITYHDILADDEVEFNRYLPGKTESHALIIRIQERL